MSTPPINIEILVGGFKMTSIAAPVTNAVIPKATATCIVLNLYNYNTTQLNTLTNHHFQLIIHPK